ncbi:acyltransferase [Rufibacter soli]
MFNKILGFIFGKCQEAYYAERYKYFRCHYNIDTNFGFNGTDIRLYGDGEIELGQNSYIGSYSTMQLTTGCILKIGENCQISHNVRMYTGSADPDQDFRIPKVKADKRGSIIIGNGVWIGANVFINPGINIGSNAVVGANSVVVRDIPENAIFGGVPARLIKFKSFD